MPVIDAPNNTVETKRQPFCWICLKEVPSANPEKANAGKDATPRAY